MKLRQIEFALAVARLNSFSRAAELCGATQSTLSSGLAQLEAALGGKLFTRTTRSVTLTPFGHHMMPFLTAVATARDEARAAAVAFLNPEQKMLRIGISPLVDMHVVSLITDPFRRSHPDVQVFFKECLLDDLSGRIEAGAIDLVILPRDVVPEALDRMAYYRDPMRYLPSGGTSDHVGAMAVSALPDDPVIMTGGGCGLNATLAGLFRKEGVSPPQYPGYAISYPVIQEWTWLGLGAAILPQTKLADPEAQSRPLTLSDGSPAEFGFDWAWRREACEVAHVAGFVDHLRSKCPGLVAGRGAAAKQ